MADLKLAGFHRNASLAERVPTTILTEVRAKRLRSFTERRRDLSPEFSFFSRIDSKISRKKTKVAFSESRNPAANESTRPEPAAAATTAAPSQLEEGKKHVLQSDSEDSDVEKKLLRSWPQGEREKDNNGKKVLKTKASQSGTFPPLAFS
jgi:hypothetical protein